MVLERDERVREDGQPDRRSLEQRRVAGDVFGFLEPAEPPPARGGREPDALRELLVRDARIGLQLLEDPPVEAIERPGHGKNIARITRWEAIEARKLQALGHKLPAFQRRTRPRPWPHTQPRFRAPSAPGRPPQAPCPATSTGAASPRSSMPRERSMTSRGGAAWGSEGRRLRSRSWQNSDDGRSADTGYWKRKRQDFSNSQNM